MKKTLFYLALIALSFSCRNNTQENASISLNNGEKWEVNEEMTPHILKGEKILEEYISTGRTDYQNLAKDLKEQNNKLIKSCTMKGESHDELHKWLHPHMLLIKDLGKADSAEEVEKIINDIQLSFGQYSTYFD